MKTLQQAKSHHKKLQQPSETNIPSTPSTNKVYYPPNSLSSLSKIQSTSKRHQLFLSPSSIASCGSPKQLQQYSKILRIAPARPDNAPSSSSSNCKKNAIHNKTLSPNMSKKEVVLSYIPAANSKKKQSPKSLKTLETTKNSKNSQKDISHSKHLASHCTAVATKMRPDRCSTEETKPEEIMTKSRIATAGDIENIKAPQNIGIFNGFSKNSEDSMRKDRLLPPKNGFELDLSPIPARKGDISSFLSEKEKIFCAKHPKKKGKYKIFRKEDTRKETSEDFYCSECAVEFAMTGIQIEKITLFSSNIRTITEEERVEKYIFKHNKELERIYNEIKSQIGQAVEEVKYLENKLFERKEDAVQRAQVIKESIKTCSEGVVLLFREETEKTTKSLNSELTQETLSIDSLLKGLELLTRDFKDNSQGMESIFQQSVYNKETIYRELIDEQHEHFILLKNELHRITRLIEERKRITFEGKIEEYKKSLKAVLQEVILELEAEESKMNNTDQITSQKIYDENMIRNLGAFEDFLRADESHDALEMKIVKSKNLGDNMVISFGNKEIFENVLQSPTEALTACSTQGETMVLPGFDELSNVCRQLGNRNCLPDEGILETLRTVEDYGKYVTNAGIGIIEEKEGEGKGKNSSQKCLFHSPEFKTI